MQYAISISLLKNKQDAGQMRKKRILDLSR